MNNNWITPPINEYDIPENNIFNQLDMFSTLNQNLPMW